MLTMQHTSMMILYNSRTLCGLIEVKIWSIWFQRSCVKTVYLPRGVYYIDLIPWGCREFTLLNSFKAMVKSYPVPFRHNKIKIVCYVARFFGLFSKQIIKTYFSQCNCIFEACFKLRNRKRLSLTIIWIGK